MTARKHPIDRVKGPILAEVERLRKNRAELQIAARASYSPGGLPTLIESNIAFVDLLGASDLMQTLTNEELGKFLAAMRNNVDHFDSFGAYEGPGRVVTFSDNVAACSPVDEDEVDGGLMWPVLSAGAFQRNLTLNGFFIRGGITRGPVYADESTIIGSALVKAYKLEQETIYPRVALDPAHVATLAQGCIEWGEALDSTQNQCVLVDHGSEGEDDVAFVNYLSFLSEADDVKEFYESLARHQELVAAKLTQYEAHEKIRRKYQWAAEYHNWACEKWFEVDGYSITQEIAPIASSSRKFTPLIEWLIKLDWDFDALKVQRFGPHIAKESPAAAAN